MRILQSLTLLSLAIAQPIAGRLAQLTHRGVSIESRSDATRGALTPAKGAFAIWGPLFAAGVALAIRSFSRPRVEAPADRQIAWLSAAACAGNSAWSLQAQFAGLGWPSVGIIVGSGAAASAATLIAEATHDPSGFARFASRTNGPLAGWLTVAAFANLEATLVHTRGRLPAPVATQRALALVLAASATATGMALATRGNVGYAAASAWGLGGVALRNRRESRPRVAAAAALGICAVTAATLMARTGRRARSAAG